MLLTTLIAAAEAGEEESSKTLFYVMGGVLAAFAVIISAIGIRGHETFPPSRGAARGVMAPRRRARAADDGRRRNHGVAGPESSGSRKSRYAGCPREVGSKPDLAPYPAD